VYTGRVEVYQVIKNKMYEFNKEKHLHILDGKRLTGTTTILGVVNKPMLIQWAANQAVEYIRSNMLTSGESTAIIPLNVLEEAKTAHRKKKEAAGDWGTTLHALIENFAKNGTAPTEGIDPIMALAFGHFEKWVADNGVTILESERNVYSREMWVGGICDLVLKIGDQTWLADIKTGSGIYPEHFWQMASYEMCLAEMKMYTGVAGYIVLNLKKDGTFEEKRSISNEDNQSAFKAALTIYRIQEKLKGTVI
jgi:hypothetical protein